MLAIAEISFLEVDGKAFAHKHPGSPRSLVPATFGTAEKSAARPTNFICYNTDTTFSAYDIDLQLILYTMLFVYREAAQRIWRWPLR